MKPIVKYNKLRGKYYTPEEIAEFIIKWAIKNCNDTILEPSCGDGVFLKSATIRLLEMGCSIENIYNNVTGVEIDEEEVQKAAQYGTQIINQDFLNFYNYITEKNLTYDIVIGNPPFICYQNLNKEYRKTVIQIMRRCGFNLSKQVNIWILFLVISCKVLKANGRLGMVLPAELFQVNYAEEVRKFLSVYFERITLITFRHLIFNNIQQEVAILLGERISDDKGIRVVELSDLHELIAKGKSCLYSTEVKPLAYSKEKWIKYCLTSEEINLLEQLNNDVRISNAVDLFDVKTNLASGENSFFIMNKLEVNRHHLHNDVTEIISRANYLKGVILYDTDVNILKQENKKVFCFTPDNISVEELNINAKKYVEWGESKGFNKNYKCKIRKRWYCIYPTVYECGDAFFIRHINLYARIIINEAGVQGESGLYRICFLNNIDKNVVVAAFINTYTLALSETLGTSYGGGILSLSINEIHKLRIPMLSAEKIDINKIDRMQRMNQHEEILKYTDKILLYEGLGLTEHEVSLLHNIWSKLRDKRLDRKKLKKI